MRFLILLRLTTWITLIKPCKVLSPSKFRPITLGIFGVTVIFSSMVGRLFEYFSEIYHHKSMKISFFLMKIQDLSVIFIIDKVYEKRWRAKIMESVGGGEILKCSTLKMPKVRVNKTAARLGKREAKSCLWVSQNARMPLPDRLNSRKCSIDHARLRACANTHTLQAYFHNK